MFLELVDSVHCLITFKATFTFTSNVSMPKGGLGCNLPEIYILEFTKSLFLTPGDFAWLHKIPYFLFKFVNTVVRFKLYFLMSQL